VAVTHSGMSTDAFPKLVRNWLKTARDPRFKRPFTDLNYQPMLEVMTYLRTNGYLTYIVTGGGRILSVFTPKAFTAFPQSMS
jgi:hypothetical protein